MVPRQKTFVTPETQQLQQKESRSNDRHHPTAAAKAWELMVVESRGHPVAGSQRAWNNQRPSSLGKGRGEEDVKNAGHRRGIFFVQIRAGLKNKITVLLNDMLLFSF